MPAASTYYTADMVRGLPEDGNRYETVHGELLVTPAPRVPHQVVLGRLHLALGNYFEAEELEGLLFSPADISWGPDTLVQPDLFVVDEQQFRAGEWSVMRGLLLAVEVLSPSSVRADRFTKRRLYQEQQVPTYWVIDIEVHRVEIWRPEDTFPTVEELALRWRHPAAKQDCIIELGSVFRNL